MLRFSLFIILLGSLIQVPSALLITHTKNHQESFDLAKRFPATCGEGTVIGKRWVISAAHCGNYGAVNVNGRSYRVTGHHRHPRWNGNYFNGFDIMLMSLDNDVDDAFIAQVQKSNEQPINHIIFPVGHGATRRSGSRGNLGGGGKRAGTGTYSIMNGSVIYANFMEFNAEAAAEIMPFVEKYLSENPTADRAEVESDAMKAYTEICHTEELRKTFISEQTAISPSASLLDLEKEAEEQFPFISLEERFNNPTSLNLLDYGYPFHTSLECMMLGGDSGGAIYGRFKNSSGDTLFKLMGILSSYNESYSGNEAEGSYYTGAHLAHPEIVSWIERVTGIKINDESDPSAPATTAISSDQTTL